MALAAIALGLGFAFSAAAQDSNTADCAANTSGAADGCDTQSKSATPAPLYHLDWVPLDQVPEALRDRQCINCGGRYIDPLADEAAQMPTGDNAIHARAINSEMRDNEVILIGEARAVQGDRHMRSDKVVVNREDESTTLTGNITLREPGMLLLGDSARIYSRTGEAIVYDGEFAFFREHMRGTADILERDTDGVIHIHDGNFTYCAPGENDWVVLSKDMEVDLDEGLATAHHARVEIEGVPVFYTPWLRLPLDDRRRTGLLWPNFGNDSSGGLDINTPIYFNLAPNYDALYAPRYIQDRGLDNELQLRYLNPLVGHWLVGGAYMNEDKRYADQVADQTSTDRWLGIVRQDGLFNDRWLSKIDYSKASDVDYMRDLETANIDAQRRTSLLQLASLDYLGDSWLLNLRAQQFQSLADDINQDYEERPQFTGQYRSSGTPFALEPILLGQYSNFGATENVVTGQRTYGEAGFSYPMLWRFGALKPTLKYRQVNYQLNDAEFYPDKTPSAGAPLFNLDGSLVFERQTSFADKGLIQTLEPRLYYLYSPHEDQAGQPIFDTAELTFSYYQLFRETRFSGHDRLDDANQISAGVTSRYIDDETGRSLLSASVGQIYYFEDRDVRLVQGEGRNNDSTSEIAGELGFTPTEKLGLRTSLVWDPNAGNLNSGFMEANYKPGNGSIFNVGYAYRRPLATVNTQPLTEEASVSSYLPLDNNWGVFAAMNYSVEDNLSVEDMVGVEYDTCCWTVRLLQLRYYNNVNGQLPDFNNPDLERQHTVQFQFVLKGMGGFGNRITNVMRDMIRGYQDREY
ncbi:MAG: LPS-assembly protein LptD [Halioglobus sp.]